jgi:predicted dehydrogenase
MAEDVTVNTYSAASGGVAPASDVQVSTSLRGDDIRIVVVGLGLRGGLVATAHRPGAGARVVGLCDLDPSTFPSWSAHVTGIGGVAPWCSVDPQDAIQRPDVDAVIVATPDHTHEELVVAALQAGKATFAEKPLAITTEACDQILTVARETGSRLYVGHNMRHFSMVREMKRLIDEGAIGEPRAVWCRHFVSHGGDFYFKDWHAQRRHVTSLLLQKGAHDIDVIHWLAGASSTRVHAFGSLSVYDKVTSRHNGTKDADWFDGTTYPAAKQRSLHPEIEVEDLSMMQMQLANGVIASYQECHYSPDYWRNYTVIGTEGRIENFGDSTGVVKLWNARHDYQPDGDREFPFAATSGGHGGADDRLMSEFIRFARDGGRTDTSPVAARDAVAAACAGAESLRSGGMPVAVVPVEPAIADYFERGQT